MKVLYLDCFSGISGDMLLAALIDLGVPLSVFEEVIAQLGIPVEIKGTAVYKNGIRASQVILAEQTRQPGERSYHQLLEIVTQSNLPSHISAKVEMALLRLAQAEGAAHGVEVERVHFHELGGLDTLVDLAGAFAGISYLGVEQVCASPLPLARGTIITQHGPLPLPAPATLNLLKGAPTYGVSIEGELVTPTGAVLVTSLAGSFGPPPAARWEKIGYGAGTQEFPHPNVLRLWLGESLDHKEARETPELAFDQDQVLVLETQVDDVNPEFLPYLRMQLEKEGALDVAFIPTMMKKGRPGIIVSILSPPDRLSSLARILFRESTAIGLRWYQAGRIKLFRTSVEVETPFGSIPVKLGFAVKPNGSREYLNLAPEYEACARRALETGSSIKEVYRAALKAADSLEPPTE